MRQIRTGYCPPASNECVFTRGVRPRKSIRSPFKFIWERVEFYMAVTRLR